MAETASQIHMSLQDLVENLRTILTEENVAKQDVTQPTAQRVQMLYFKMLVEFGFSDTMLQSRFVGPNGGGGGRNRFGGSWDDFPELYQHTDAVDVLKDALAYFFQSVEHQERPPFGLLDLVDPDSKRTRRFLAAMVNFWQFCNANYQMLSEVRESVLERAATKAALEKEVAELRERTEEIRKNNAEDAMKESNLEEKMVEMRDEMGALVGVIEHDKRRAEEHKRLVEELHSRRERLEAEVDALRREEAAVRASLRNAGEMDEMEAELERLKTEGSELLSREKALDHKASELAAKSRDLESLLELQAEVLSARERTDRDRADLGAAERKAQLLQAEEADLVGRCDTWRARVAEARAQVAQGERKWKKVREMKQTEMDMLAAEVEAEKKKLGEDEIVASEYRARIRRAEREVQEVRSAASARVAVAENEQLKMLEAARERFRELEGRRKRLREAYDTLREHGQEEETGAAAK